MSPQPKHRSHRGRSQSSTCWIAGRQLLPTASVLLIKAEAGPAQANATVVPLVLGSKKSTSVSLKSAGQQLKVNLAISVPKKIVKRAVWRNYAKRVAREAWRNLSEPFMQHDVAPYFVLLRLRQLPTAQMLGAIAGARAVKRQLRLECDQVLVRLLRNH